MPALIEIVLLVFYCILLTWLNSRLIKSLTKLAKFFGIKELIIAFFVLGLAVQLPNFFVDVGAALRGLPEIAVGDMIGGNLVDLTLVMALAIFFSKKHISTDSKIVQGSAVITSIIAILPLLLMFDGKITRIDGLILIGAFMLYVIWMFSKDDRFKKEFHRPVKISRAQIVIMVVEIIAILVLLFFASQAIINIAQFLAGQLGTSISLVAIVIIGLANCFPELYLSIMSIRKGQNWLVLGDLMSSVIGTATLVFGVVALVHPFTVTGFSHILIGRSFLIVAAIFFLITIKTGRKLTKKEGLILLFIYILFLLAEIFVKF